MALATAPFGAPGSDWGMISLTTHPQHRTSSDKSFAPEADCAVRVGRGCIRRTAGWPIATSADDTPCKVEVAGSAISIGWPICDLP